MKKSTKKQSTSKTKWVYQNPQVGSYGQDNPIEGKIEKKKFNFKKNRILKDKIKKDKKNNLKKKNLSHPNKPLT